MIKDKKKKTYSFFFGFNQGRNKPTLAGGQKKFSKKLNKFFNVIKQLLIKYKILSNNYFFFLQGHGSCLSFNRSVPEFNYV